MSDINDLLSRIDGALTSVKDKVKQEQQQRLQDHLERQKRLEQYEKVQARVVEIARPRLDALAKRAGERVAVTPSVSQTRRAAKFEFKSPRAYLTLTFSVAPDAAVKNVVVEYDLRIVPVLWKVDSHAEFTTPIDAFDVDGLTKWLDDRIVGFVELYIKINEGELYDKAEYVEDPIAKVRFPKFAAGATLEHGGQTYFFIDERSKQDFARQKGIASA
jgi:YHS domain-containing protein